jgi:site-specific DNA recombinase
MICCSRCKALSRNMSEPRSWSGVGEVRSTRHQRGSLNVMSGAPFGYRYISVHAGGGQARFEPVAERARVVQQIFSWIGRDGCSLSQVCRRLHSASELTATGKQIWSREAVWHVLQNPASRGRAA